jgi:membrane dipeptidase
MSDSFITRRHFARLTAAALPAMAACSAGGSEGLGDGSGGRGGAAQATDALTSGVEWAGYSEATVIDALASPGPFNVQNRIGAHLSEEMVANAAASGITAVNVTVSGGGEGDGAFIDTVRHLGYWDREIATHPDVLMKVRDMATLDTANTTGRVGLIMGFQDTTSLGTDIARLDIFDDFGVRVIQLTYNVRNAVGDGCLQAENGGLTPFGRDVVARMNELGMLVDLSHCGMATTADGIAHSNAPVSITHSGCRAVYEHPRSKPDDILRALADGGGVLGIYMMPFLNAEGPATADHLYQHIEHAVNVCGEDHVGIGSDNSITPTVADEAYRSGLKAFDEERQRLGIGAPREYELLFVPELNEPQRMGMIADGLLARGHSEARVEKIVGGNWARLFGEVWKA